MLAWYRQLRHQDLWHELEVVEGQSNLYVRQKKRQYFYENLTEICENCIKITAERILTSICIKIHIKVF